MPKMKYIIANAGGYPEPYVFSDTVNHADMARNVGAEIVLGAGFCGINPNREFECYGESVSLRVKSRGEYDSKILNQKFGLVDPY